MANLFTKTDKVAELIKKSNNVFNIFESSMNQWQQINAEIETEKKNQESKRNALEKQVVAIQSNERFLTEQTERNNKMINKIKSFLND